MWFWQLTRGRGEAADMPGTSVGDIGWSHTCAVLLHSACMQQGRDALEHTSTRKAGLAAAPEPGVCHQYG